MKTCNYAGKLVYFDDELWEFIRDVTGWSLNKNSKNYYYLRCTKGKYTGKMLSRVLMNCPSNLFVDHKNGNTLDNRLENLRIVTTQQNNFNREGHITKLLPKGVFKSGARYRARIKINGSNYDLGTFGTVTEAELAYKETANKYFTEYAHHNSKD